MATRKEIIDIQVQYGTLEGLESQLEQVNQELKQTQIGSEAFNSLTKEAQKLNAAIEGVNNQVAGMTLDDKLFAADGAIKTFAGSVEATVGALGLLGIESEALGAFEEKAASAISFGMGLKDMAEGFGQVTQMAAKAEIATKLFGNTSRAALISTGVGAIVVALGLIVAYWDKVSVAIGLATDKTQAFQEASDAAAKDTAKFNEELLSFENTLNQSKAGVVKKEDALKQYNETLGKSLGIAKNLEQAEKLVALNAPLFVQLTLKKAEAQVLLARAAEASAKIASGEAMEVNWWQTIISAASGLTSSATNASFQIQNLGKTLRDQKVYTEEYTKSISSVADIQKQLDGNVLKVTGSINYQSTSLSNNTTALKENILQQEKLAKIEKDLKEETPKVERVKLDKIIPSDSYRKNLFTEASKGMSAYTETAVQAAEEQVAAEERANGALQEILGARAQFYTDFAFAVGDSFGQISQLFEEGSKQQKAFALTELAINTAAGFSNAYRIAQQSSLGTGPAAAFAMPLFYAQQVVTLLATVNKARSILKASPSGTSGGVNAGTTPGAIRPTVPNIPQPMVVPTVKAYVLSGDVRNAQEADAKLSKRRTLG